MKALAVILGVCLLAGCLGIRTYYRNDYGIDFLGAYKGLAVIKTESEMEKDDGEKATRKLEGMAIKLDKGLILSLTHVTELPMVEAVRMPFGTLFFSYKKKLSERHFINGKEIKLIGRKGDVSIFQGDHKESFPFPFGNSDLLEVGDRIAVIGFSFTKLFNFKEGLVSALKVGDAYGKMENDVMLITVSINPGDSGSPALAFRNGRCEIVGIVNAGIRDKGMGFAIKINEVKEALEVIDVVPEKKAAH